VVRSFSPWRALAAVWRPIERRLAAIGLRLVAPWERLSVPVQIAIAFPTLSVLLFLLHLGPLNQPPIRAAFYGVFWSILATPAVIIATRNELQKRHKLDQQQPKRPSATD
jgi:hypothetical protein